MPQLVPQQPPPPDYYAANLRCLLEAVQRRSGDLLDPAERSDLHATLALSVPAQRLYARLLTRRSAWLRVAGLEYAEVADGAAALTELCAAGLVGWLAPAPADVLLGLLTRAEQRALFPGVRGATKPEWVEACVGRYPEQRIRAAVADRHPWVGVTGRRSFRVCQVLFFGGDGGDLSSFVVQDLGIRRYETYRLDHRTRPFQDRPSLDAYLRCRRCAGLSRQLEESPALAGTIVEALSSRPLSRPEARARDRTLNRVGQWLERRGDTAAALGCYAHSNSHPARERRVRLLHRGGSAEAAAALLSAMRHEPWAPEEEDFAGRFPGRRSPVSTPVTRCALADATPSAIERHALHLLTANGGRGWHLENALPLGLAGLAFWDEIFAPVPGAFSHPFQIAPHDLFWPDFARVRQPALEARVQRLRAPGGLADALRDAHRRKCGTTNRLVHWSALTGEVLDGLLGEVPHEALLRLAVHTIFGLQRARTGFPDLLLVYGRGAWELVEVKSPTDQLQPAQRIWLRVLESLRIPARVLRFRSC